MKRTLLLLPLIAALSGLTYADDAAKPGMNGIGGMDKMDMKSMNAKGDLKTADGTKPGGDMKPGEGMKGMHEMHEKCMGDGKTADNGKGMDDMKAMHDHCMDSMADKKAADKGAKKKKLKHRKAKPDAAPEHDHNHGTAPGQ